jgi:hypothetical protein
MAMRFLLQLLNRDIPDMGLPLNIPANRQRDKEGWQ